MPNKTLIVSDSCPHCQDLKDKIREKGLDVRVVAFDSEEGAKIVKEHNITAVPECVILTDEGHLRKCSEDEFRNLKGTST